MRWENSTACSMCSARQSRMRETCAALSQRTFLPQAGLCWRGGSAPGAVPGSRRAEQGLEELPEPCPASGFTSPL